MTLQECYADMGGDYSGVVTRLCSESMVQKFILRFLDDKSYKLFCNSMESKNYEESFRAAHTIKGICQNLGFTRLLESSSEMSEALRHGWTPKADTLINQFELDYRDTINAIQKFQKEYRG